jgi:hypothetical protein
MVNFAQNMHILYEEPKSDDTYPYKILEPALFPPSALHMKYFTRINPNFVIK